MNQSRSLRTEYVFARFRLSADGTMLTRDRAPMSLRPKLLRTLLVLVERAGRVVRRRSLSTRSGRTRSSTTAALRETSVCYGRPLEMTENASLRLWLESVIDS